MHTRVADRGDLDLAHPFLGDGVEAEEREEQVRLDTIHTRAVGHDQAAPPTLRLVAAVAQEQEVLRLEPLVDRDQVAHPLGAAGQRARAGLEVRRVLAQLGEHGRVIADHAARVGERAFELVLEGAALLVVHELAQLGVDVGLAGRADRVAAEPRDGAVGFPLEREQGCRTSSSRRSSRRSVSRTESTMNGWSAISTSTVVRPAR